MVFTEEILKQVLENFDGKFSYSFTASKKALNYIIEHSPSARAYRLLFRWRERWVRTLPVTASECSACGFDLPPTRSQLLCISDVYEPVMRHELPAQLLTA